MSCPSGQLGLHLQDLVAASRSSARHLPRHTRGQSPPAGSSSHRAMPLPTHHFMPHWRYTPPQLSGAAGDVEADSIELARRLGAMHGVMHGAMHSEHCSKARVPHRGGHSLALTLDRPSRVQPLRVLLVEMLFMLSAVPRKERAGALRCTHSRPAACGAGRRTQLRVRAPPACDEPSDSILELHISARNDLRLCRRRRDSAVALCGASGGRAV